MAESASKNSFVTRGKAQGSFKPGARRAVRRRSAAIAPPVSRLALCFASLRSRRRARAASSALGPAAAGRAAATATAARHGAARWICAAKAATA